MDDNEGSQSWQQLEAAVRLRLPWRQPLFAFADVEASPVIGCELQKAVQHWQHGAVHLRGDAAKHYVP